MLFFFFGGSISDGWSTLSLSVLFHVVYFDYLCKKRQKTLISVENLAVEFGATPLFRGVSFVINDKDRIALVGKNGAGKSTMLKIIAGMQLPTSGVVSVSGDTTIGYLPQVMVLSDEHTVMEDHVGYHETRQCHQHYGK